MRPLDDVGELQAEELVRPLSRFEVSQTYSDDYVRCVQTVAPLSEAIGVPEEEVLSEAVTPPTKTRPFI